LVQEIPQGAIGVTNLAAHQLSTSAESFSQAADGSRSRGVDDGSVIVELVGMTDPMGSLDVAESGEELSGDDRSCFTEFSDPFHLAAPNSKRGAVVSAVERSEQSKHSHPFPVKSDHGESHSSGVDERSVIFRSLGTADPIVLSDESGVSFFLESYPDVAVDEMEDAGSEGGVAVVAVNSEPGVRQLVTKSFNDSDPRKHAIHTSARGHPNEGNVHQSDDSKGSEPTQGATFDALS
jgi:hypothetical protein